jgi:hypothetical protein
MDLTKDTVTLPLYAALWRAPLGATDFGVHLAGQTGMGKSELTALIQQHFGVSMNARNFPGSWESTENALEMLLFQAKDTIVVIDDFKPKGCKYDQERIHAKADRIFRSTGNGSARARLNSELQHRAGCRPRCMIISTGEDVPKGESLKSRAILLFMNESITKGELSKNLSIAQKDASDGRYAQAMAGYIEWLAPRIEHILAQDQVLASTSLNEKKRPTVTIRRRLQGLQRDVLHIKKETLFPSEPLPECSDSLGSLDSTPTKPASEEASGVSQVSDSNGPEPSGQFDSQSNQASQFNPWVIPGEGSNDYDVFGV